MEHIEPSSTSQPFINEVLSPLNLDCYSCNFGPVGIAELEQSLGSPAVIVEQNRQFEIIPELKHAKFFGFFDRGSVQIPEDIALISLPFMAAFDGTSGVFYNGGPQKILYETGITGGQMAIKLAAEKFCSAEPTQTVLDILNQANSAIAHEHQLAGLNLSFGGTLGGAVGAAVKLSSPSVKIVQFGDGVVIWELKDGSTGMMGNQTRIHEIEMLATIASLMERLAQEYPGAALPFLRSRMWEVFGPFLLEKRNERINN